MDIVTAKALVSALLVFCIAGFSIVSFHAVFAEVGRELKAGWARRAAPTEGARID